MFTFHSSYGWIIFIIILIMCVYMLDRLCIPGINVIWLRCMILLIYCSIRFANILLRIFPSLFIRDCCLVAKSWLTLLWPQGLQPARLLCPWDSLGKNTEVGCHFLLQGIFPTQGSNLCLLHWQVDFFHWVTWEAYSSRMLACDFLFLWCSFLVSASG